ncbi:MAG TPA: NRDE family protein [Balneolaceae bacterium]|nr:NRDE family protein [Balneolaceae bacterium]
MCLIVFSYKSHPAYDLIVAANRDESYARPTRAAQFWSGQPQILAGKDLKAGGTWMGVTKEGAFSAITNFRDPTIQKENPPSRGHLVLDYLKNPVDSNAYLQQVDEKGDQYSGFNLLAGTVDQLAYYSNQQKKIRQLEPGLYGLSNHLLNTPWPKVVTAKQSLEKIIQGETIPEEALFELLADERQASEGNLPNTGIPKNLEKIVSPVFIKSDRYGTRCSTILLIDKEGKVVFEERRFKAGTQNIDEVSRFEFEIEHNT